MGIFNRKDDTASPPALRTLRQIQADPDVGEGYIVVPDARRAEYEALGFLLVEDLAGDQCLMKLNKPMES